MTDRPLTDPPPALLAATDGRRWMRERFELCREVVGKAARANIPPPIKETVQRQ